MRFHAGIALPDEAAAHLFDGSRFLGELIGSLNGADAVHAHPLTS